MGLFGGGKKEENNGLWCPFNWGVQALESGRQCKKEKCMIWNPDAQDCNINVIAKALQTTEQ